MHIDGVDYRIAETRTDLEGAVRLVYHNYIEKGYCRLNPHEMHFYLHDVLPETRTLVASRDGTVVSTLTLVFDSPLGLPSDNLYRHENDALRAGGRRIAEISKLSSDRRLDCRTLRVLAQLFRLAYLLAYRLRRIDDLVILIEPHHEGFYQSSMGFSRIGGLKPDPSARDAPSLLLRLDLPAVTEEGRQQHACKPGSSRRYNHYVLDPRLATLTEELRLTDDHLDQLHQRMAHVTPDAVLDAGEQNYLDLRLFAIGFNCDKISLQAQTQDHHGHFREALQLYERLLMVLPAHYAPDRRQKILSNAMIAAWHTGQHDRAIAFTTMMQREATTTRLRANAMTLHATVLHAQGKRSEAAVVLQDALALPDLDPVVKANLFHTTGRIAIDEDRFADARRQIDAGMALLHLIEPEAMRMQLHGLLAHDRYSLERQSGNIDAADAALAEFRPHLERIPQAHRLMHLSGAAMLELARCRPREALAHGRAALACCDPESSPLNAALIISSLASASLLLGDPVPAQAYGERALSLAGRVKHPGAIIGAAAAVVEAHLMMGRLEDARALLEQIAAPLTATLPASTAFELLELRASVARNGRDWPSAARWLDTAIAMTDGEHAVQHAALLARIEVELCSGSLPAAASLAQRLPSPQALPGSDGYRCRWLALQAILRTVAGDPAALADLDEPFDQYRRHGAILCLADAGVWMLDVASACPCDPLRHRAIEILGEAVRAAAMPFHARRLERALADE